MQLSLDTAMERTFTVAEFAGLLAEVVEHSFPHDVWIQGEVRDMRRTRSGHVYFSLVDATTEAGRRPEAMLSVVLFDSTRRTINAQIKRAGGGLRIDDGIAVRVRGVPEFYAPQGRLNLRMTAIDPDYTMGQMAASRDRLMRVLSDEGLLHRNQSVPLPVAPSRIGLVTAEGSAARADFVEELSGAGISFHILFAPTPVQGDGAARRIALAIRACESANADVIAVVRGGGARTDLIAFDDELVARTIAGCSVPVLTGIGHEIDTAVADEVAHLALKTPTACAGHIVDANLAAHQQSTDLWREIAGRATAVLAQHERRTAAAAHDTRARVSLALRQSDLATNAAAVRVRDLTGSQLDRARHRLVGHGAGVGLQSHHRLATAKTYVHHAGRQLGQSSLKRVREAERQVESAALRARILDPARVLARGWSITTNAAGAVVRSPDEVSPGSLLKTRVAGGTIESTVEETPEPKESS